MKSYVRSPLTAVLGPTNTGKTHLAIERMLAHSSGMMGFPLRLLAREVYDRVVAQRGLGSAALVTGEERIWPDTARYLLCTAEAMPLTAQAPDGRAGDAPRDVAFVALDEAQIGQDRERGHVFTSRLLHARGREETMILGSGSLAPLVRNLLPDADITARPRFSTLSYDGPRKLSRLPPRSVIVAFSAEEVYAIAEALRRFSGGAAVVMGALSPSTRNAQVAMFQAGEVDYLVATDAIGMGLNLDVSHVAFASLNKFDGVRQRRLTVSEMAQIAGRAGRHQRDGTFGSVGAEAAFTDEEVRAIEDHHFPPVDWLYWRNPEPDTSSVAALIAGLEQAPPHPALRPSPESTDLSVLRRMADDGDALALVDGPAAVRRLWSACSLPDFRKSGPEAHGRLVARLWKDLGTGNGHVDADWFTGQLRALDDSEGSVEKLADRIAAVRTFCYMAQRADWLAEPAAMAEQASGIEARLSDALHHALTARFVDRRTTVLLRALGQDASSLPVAVDEAGVVRVDGEAIGQLEGFTFRVDPAARAEDHRMMLAAAERYLSVELASRATALAASNDRDFALILADGAMPVIHWRGLTVASVTKGRHRLAPKLVLDKTLAALDSHVVAAVQARLQSFADARIGQHLRPLVAMAARARDADAAPGLRAILATLVDSGGNHPREPLDPAIADLPPEARAELRDLGVRVGTLDLFHPRLLKPGSLSWIAALDAAWRGSPSRVPPSPGIALVAADGDELPPAAGFRRVGKWWLRVDLAERIAHYTHAARAVYVSAMVAARQARAAERKQRQRERSAMQRAAAAAKAAGVGAGTPPEPDIAVEVVPDNAPVEAVVDPVAQALVEAGPDLPTDDGVTDDASVTDTAPVSATESSSTESSEAVAGDSDLGEPPVEGAFRVNPELARSIGLPLEDRIAMLRLLGFRTVHPPKGVTVEEEPLLWWMWRGRKSFQGDPRRRPRDEGERGAQGNRPARRREDGRFDAAGKLSSRRGAADGGKGKPRPGQDRSHQDRRPDRDNETARRPSHNPANSPFAALAGMFDKKGGDKKGDDQ